MLKAAVLISSTLILGACATSPALVPSPGHAAAPSAAKSAGVAIVAQAQTMLGQPYRWGGAAPGGFDCSGLVVYATRSAGLNLPRTAQEQLKSGWPVERGQVQTGDLVFLHLTGKELHVGIAVDSHRFVHAPSTGGYVRVDSLDAAPYERGYFAARRITLTSSHPPQTDGRPVVTLDSRAGLTAAP